MTAAVPAHLRHLRHELHRIPELSGQEVQTAAAIAAFLRARTPDRLLTGLGGHGVAAVYDSGAAGPSVLVRCELDGLPITEKSDAEYRSTLAGQGHLCGHDGHMAMVAGLADWLKDRPLRRGRAILLFQPAEETGKGAAAVLADPEFATITPDIALSLHNIPGLDLGRIDLCTGPANCASRGLRIRLTGRSSHASMPQDGVSPAGAVADLLTALPALSGTRDLGPDFALVTVTHCRVGEPAFGISPGEAEIWATLRTVSDARMGGLVAAAEALVTETAGAHGLAVDLAYDDIFEACVNDPEAVAILDAACAAAGHPARRVDQPIRASEDFGRFGGRAKSAMFWLGAGTGCPQLHSPDYDFPDTLIPVGLAVFRQALTDLLVT